MKKILFLRTRGKVVVLSDGSGRARGVKWEEGTFQKQCDGVSTSLSQDPLIEISKVNEKVTQWEKAGCHWSVRTFFEYLSLAGRSAKPQETPRALERACCTLSTAYRGSRHL